MLCPHCRKPLTASVRVGEIKVTLPDGVDEQAAIEAIRRKLGWLKGPPQ